jgi:ABC-type sugar transport system ATPase subunit
MVVKVGSTTIEAICPAGAAEGQEVTLSVRPESIVVHTDDQPRPNQVPATVRSVLFVGDAVDCRLDLGGPIALARLHPRTRVAPGDTVAVELAVDDITVISEEHGIVSGAHTD